MKTFQESVEQFLKVAYWLTDEDSAVVTGLEAAAAGLDTKFQTAMWSEYNKTVKYLLDRKPVEEETEEEEEDAIAGDLDA